MTSQSPLSVRADDSLSEAFRDSGTPGRTPRSEASEGPVHDQEHKDKSNNPYRQHQTASAVSLTRSTSQETEHSVPGVRKKTPVRAVFYDLPTAHLSITTGSARSRSREAINSLLESHDDKDSIPLQELPSTKLHDNLLHNLPLPPLPAAISRPRDNNLTKQRLRDDDGNRLSKEHGNLALSMQQDTQSQLSSSIKHAPGLKLGIPMLSQQKAIPFEKLGNGKEAKSSRYGSHNHSSGHFPNFKADLSGSVPSSSKEKHGSAEFSKEDTQSLNLPSTPANVDSHILPSRFPSSGTQSNGVPSLPEGSTVGNIYNHYTASSSGDADSEATLPSLNPASAKPSYHPTSNSGLSSSSILDDPVVPSALNIRKQRRVDRLTTNPNGQPPIFALPTVPQLATRRVIPSSSQGIEQSSSYGDTKNLLEITQRSHWSDHESLMSRSEARNDLRSEVAASELEEYSEPSLPALNSNNPFKLRHGPHVVVSQHNDHECIYDDDCDLDHTSAGRLPLEREVSKALRRVSGVSTQSNGSISSSVLQYGGFEPKTSTSKVTGLLRKLNIEDTPPSESESFGEDTKNGVAQTQTFYDEGAISHNWITAHRQNAVRIPINHNGLFPNSPPESPLELNNVAPGRQNLGVLSEFEGDINDWETVGESARGVGFKGTRDAFRTPGETTIHRAGSSLANTSDDGTSSLHIAEVDEYGSTERIAQHPGTIQYSGDYRQRDIKKTRIPVFLPVFREHKVNGYLADSNRIRPPYNPIPYRPPPLANPHTNPFKSPPPEVLSTGAAKQSLLQRRNRRRPRPNHFPPSTKSLAITEAEVTRQGVESISSEVTPSASAQRERALRTLIWMEESGEPEPEPTASRTKRQFLSPINPVGRPDRPNSWQHMMILGRGDKIDGYNSDGSPVIEGSSSGNKGSADPNLQGATQTDDLVEPTRYAGNRRAANNRQYKPLVQGPPGAFYQGLARSKQDHKRAGSSDVRERPARIPSGRNNSKDYPTNALRPLSLLVTRPTTPNEMENRNPFRDRPHDFVYRSPLAPLKHLTWQQLYTDTQLTTIRESAVSDGFVEGPIPPNAGLLGRDVREESSQRHLFESPRLCSWSRDSSIRTNYRQRKTKISIVVLILCNFFPPLLFLYAIGQLDGIIMWWTSGELSTFGKNTKRWAYILMCSWGLAISLGLVIFLILWFTILHQGA